jgi:hypothetical protein
MLRETEEGCVAEKRRRCGVNDEVDVAVSLLAADGVRP